MPINSPIVRVALKMMRTAIMNDVLPWQRGRLNVCGAV